jgi:hypothetical protein
LSDAVSASVPIVLSHQAGESRTTISSANSHSTQNGVHNSGTMAMAERIYPEILSQGIPPTQPLGMMASLLSQHCEQGFERGASNPK